MLTLLLVVILVWIVSALASASEAAIFSVPYPRARALAKARKPGAKALLKIKEAMTTYVSAIVIVDNIADIVGSALVGVVAAKVFSSVALGVFFGVFTLVSIIGAKILPKTLGEAHADRIAPAVAPIVIILARAMKPVIWLIDVAMKPFRSGSNTHAVSEDEIKMMALMGHESGDIEKDESRMIQRVFRLNDITADDMMTPASSVETVPADMKLGAGRDRIHQVRHSRLPIMAEDGETVIGVVLTRDLLMALAKDAFESTPAEFAQEPLFIPSDMPADDLLPLFQQKEQHLGVVVGADRRMLGVVTLEDVIEELVGEITDEKDIRPETIKRLSKSEVLVDEGTSISKINHFFNTKIEAGGAVGDFVMERFGRRPRAGEVLIENGLAYTIVSMTRTRPKLISIRKQA